MPWTKKAAPKSLPDVEIEDLREEVKMLQGDIAKAKKVHRAIEMVFHELSEMDTAPMEEVALAVSKEFAGKDDVMVGLLEKWQKALDKATTKLHKATKGESGESEVNYTPF